MEIIDALYLGKIVELYSSLIMSNTAPIVLFVYNRPSHTLRTLEALSQNVLADQSKLFIFCDGPKGNASETDLQKIREVRQIVGRKQWCGEVIISEATVNKGLKSSILSGITKILETHDQLIVLEDDLVTSVHFLQYMNTALQKYAHVNSVKQISGHQENLRLKKANRSYFLPLASCWGWGTWKRVWMEIDFEANDYAALKTDKSLRHQFDLNGSYPFAEMLIKEKETPEFNSWAILFMWNIFRLKGLTLYPDHSLVTNIGFDGSGVHHSEVPQQPVKEMPSDLFYQIHEYPDPGIDNDVFNRLKLFYRYGFTYKYSNLFVNFLYFMFLIFRKTLRKWVFFLTRLKS